MDSPNQHVPAPSPNGEPIRCDWCGAPVQDLHCKLVCRNCGAKRD
jgi:hypothetical protein